MPVLSLRFLFFGVSTLYTTLGMVSIGGTTGTHAGKGWRLQGHNRTQRCTSGERVRVPQREPQDHVCSEKNEHDKPLTGVEATFGVRGAGSGLLASTPPRPGQHGCGTARKRKEESAKQTADFRYGQRKRER